MSIERKGNFAVVGELALTGETRPIKGVLAMALAAANEGRDGILVPSADAEEAAVVSVFPIRTLSEAVGLPSGTLDITEVPQDVVRSCFRATTVSYPSGNAPRSS